MAKRTQYPAEYRTLLHRYTELRVAGRFGLTQEQRDEMADVAAQMEAIELDYHQRSRQPEDPFRVITTDYEMQMEYGDHGGREG